MRSCSVGAMYCSSPSIDSGRRRAAELNSSSGIAVTTPGRREDQRVPETLGRERALPDRAEPHQVDERRRGEDEGLDSESGHRADAAADPVLDQPVEPEAQRERQRDPGQLPVPGGDDDDGRGPEPERHPLHRAQPLAQDDDRERDGDQRVDVVPEGGVDHAVGEDAEHEHEPVDGEQHGREREQRERPPVPQRRDERAPRPRHGEQEDAEQQRPHDAVGDDLDRPGRLQQREVQGEHAPQDVGADAGRQAGSVQRCGGRAGRWRGSRAPDEPRSRLTAAETSPSVRLQQVSPALQGLLQGLATSVQRALHRRPRRWAHLLPGPVLPVPPALPRSGTLPVRVARMQAGRRDDAATGSGSTTTSGLTSRRRTTCRPI